MANDYLTLEQVCDLLGKTASEVNKLVADGKLQQLRDAGKVFFKRGEVADVAAKEGSSIVDLSAGDEAPADPAPESFGSALKSLADESSGFGVLDKSPLDEEPLELGSGAAEAMKGDDSSAIPMAESDTEEAAPAPLGLDEFPEHLPAAPAAGGPELSSEIDLLDDTGISDPIPQPKQTKQPELVAEVPDLGLSGSSIISLETGLDEVSAPAPKPAARKEEAKSGKVGISVFDDDELDIASDPMGETRIASGVEDLEPVGSGSGLLDLTQEKDDTSLGAELLDVISPTDAGETETEAETVIEAGETVSETGGTMLETDMSDDPVAAAAGKAASPKAPKAVSTSATPGSVPLNACLILGIVGLAVVGLATAAQIQGVWPGFLSMFAKSIMHYSVFGGLLLVALASGVFGILAGRK